MEQTPDIAMTSPDSIPMKPQSPSSSISKKRKSRPSKNHEITTTTIKTPTFSYLHLTLLNSSQTTSDIDTLTLRTYLTQALTQFLGLTGSSIPIDILKQDEGKGELWIRVPREDCSAVVAAVTGWTGGGSGGKEEVGWRVGGRGSWLGSLTGGEVVGKIWGD